MCNHHLLHCELVYKIPPVYGFPPSVRPSVYPTNNVSSTPLRPGSGDDLMIWTYGKCKLIDWETLFSSSVEKRWI